jgi:hypothetical protein
MVKLPLRRSRELGPSSTHGESRYINHHFTCCIAINLKMRIHSIWECLAVLSVFEVY